MVCLRLPRLLTQMACGLETDFLSGSCFVVLFLLRKCHPEQGWHFCCGMVNTHKRRRFYMKNALLYCVNDNDYQICRMINSINSFAHYNEKLLSGLTVYIITDSKIGLNLRPIDNRVKYQVIKDVHFDYSKLSTGYRKNWSYHVYFRWEIFSNPLFWDIDNLLYMDNDTEFVGSVQELFIKRDKPRILMVQEKVNHVNDELGRHTIDKYYNSGVMLITPKIIGK